MPLVEECFGSFGEIRRAPGRGIGPDDLRDVDALLVRSVTRVDGALLQGSPVKFVGTATIGVDHIHGKELEALGVHHVSAPGCNADSVADWVVACIAHLELERGISVLGRQSAVVGAGNVGSRVARRLRALGFDPQVSDPPRAQSEANFNSSNLCDLKGVELICLHAPLTQKGSHPTKGMIDDAFLSSLPDGAILISAGRGAVVDFEALRRHFHRLTLCLDVWDPEPEAPMDVVEKVEVATPHIAGYSLQSKWRGTRMLHQSFCRHRELDFQEVPDPIEAPTIESKAKTWQEVVLEYYRPQADTQRTREGLRSGSVGPAFDALRKTYPLRHEFSFPKLEAPALAPEQLQRLESIGFRIH